MNAIWGPKVWYILHRLSFYSNRKDVCAAWKTFLRLLSETIPCALCRNHMREYMIANSLVFKPTDDSNKIRSTIVEWLYNFHNHVNRSLKKEEYPYDLLELTYGQGTFGQAVRDAKSQFTELEVDWNGVYIRNFKMAFNYLCGLIGGGPF